MGRLPKIIGMIGITVLLAAEAARGDEQDVIDYREAIMRTLNEQSEALGLILSGAVPQDNAVAHLEIIATTAGTALKAFEAKVPGGEARAEVWSKWPDFSKRMNEFAAKTAEAAKIAKQSGVEAGLARISDALSCKGCHDVYREEKKKK